MICTFGDVTDVIWWRELDLPTRTLIGRDGRLSTTEPAWIPADGQAAYAAIAGKTAKQAQAIVVEQLRDGRRAAGRAASDHPPGQVLREG